MGIGEAAFIIAFQWGKGLHSLKVTWYGIMDMIIYQQHDCEKNNNKRNKNKYLLVNTYSRISNYTNTKKHFQNKQMIL